MVDLDCVVRGYDRLTLVDASVMPDLPKCNTHLTTVAIAERFIQRLGARRMEGGERRVARLRGVHCRLGRCEAPPVRLSALV